LSASSKCPGIVREGNLQVPYSRYGHDIESCARVVLAALDVLEQETGSVTTADVEHLMGLVVNDHDEPFTLIRDHGWKAQRALIEDLILEDWATNAPAARRASGPPQPCAAIGGPTTVTSGIG
jgi:hypothetical protein